MKHFFALLLCIVSISISAQSNPFTIGTPEHRLYEIYLSCEGEACAVFLPEVANLYDLNPKPTMAAELLYNYFVSISCFKQGDFTIAADFARRNKALLEKYEEKRTQFWELDDYRYFKGLEQISLKKLNLWNDRAIGSKPLPNAKAICPSCPQFPFPPPRASAQLVLNKNLFGNCKTLSDASRKISNALDQCNYEKRYYAVPEGIAIMARLEQFNTSDATSLPEPDRWSANLPPMRDFSDYLKSLFVAVEGRFRILVFVITKEPFTQTNQNFSREEATDWLSKGLNVLPSSFNTQKWTNEYNCTALIYEFKITSAKQRAQFVEESRFSANTHLEMSRILKAINN